MKKYSLCFLIFSSFACADDEGIQQKIADQMIRENEDHECIQRGGIYIGAYLGSQNERYDFELTHWDDARQTGNPGSVFHSIKYKNTLKGFVWGGILGWKSYNFFGAFIATEVRCSPTNVKLEKNYTSDEIPGGDIFYHKAMLSIKRRFDTAFLFRLGKSLCISKSFYVTPYAVVGIHIVKTNLSFNYFSADQSVWNAAIGGGSAVNMQYANRNISKWTTGYVYGAGVEFKTSRRFSVNLECQAIKNRAIHYNTNLGNNGEILNGSAANLDNPGKTRSYTLKGTNSIAILFGINYAF